MLLMSMPSLSNIPSLIRTAFFPALIIIACACLNETTPHIPNKKNQPTTEPITTTINPITHNNLNTTITQTSKITTDVHEKIRTTPDLSQENPVKADKETTEEEIRTIISSSHLPDRGFVSLDERILRSTIIARATMRSSKAYATKHSAPLKYFPIVRFTFDIHEYLKGNSADIITADLKVSCTKCYDNEQDAINAANNWLSTEANRWWENRESIIFVQDSEIKNPDVSGNSDSANYKFIPWFETGIPTYDYATTRNNPYFDADAFSVLSERNRVWLPSSDPTSGASGTSDTQFMLGDKPKDAYPRQNAVGTSSFDTNISLSELKSQIQTMTDLLKQGENIQNYEECLRTKYRIIRIPWTPYSLEFPVKSGLAAGSVIDSGGTGDEYYGIYFFSGIDKDSFEIAIEDNDTDPYNGYFRVVKTTRPLPQGDYSITYHQNPGILRICRTSPRDDSVDTPTANWTIRATAPAGTLHEAFFDPVAIGAAVGADSANGALIPATFTTTNATDAELRRIDWTSNTVKMQIANPPASLADHHIDFIALDGSVALRLDFDDATTADAGAVRTFSWSVCDQPWSPGDQLMLRISESPSDLTGVTRQTSCPGGATQTPTPSPTATPTTAPDSQPTATPTTAPDSQPTTTPNPTTTSMPTETPSPTPTSTPSPTVTVTPESPPDGGVGGAIDTPTPTPSPTASATTTPTPIQTATPTVTQTPTATQSPTPTITATPTPEDEPPPGGVSGQTDTPTVAPTATPTPTATEKP